MTRTLDPSQRNPDWWERSARGGPLALSKSKVLTALRAGHHPNEICRASGASGSTLRHLVTEFVEQGVFTKPKHWRNSSVNGASSLIPHTEEVG